MEGKLENISEFIEKEKRVKPNPGDISERERKVI